VADHPHIPICWLVRHHSLLLPATYRFSPHQAELVTLHQGICSRNSIIRILRFEKFTAVLKIDSIEIAFLDATKSFRYTNYHCIAVLVASLCFINFEHKSSGFIEATTGIFGHEESPNRGQRPVGVQF
jgi:hypothetical protein